MGANGNGGVKQRVMEDGAASLMVANLYLLLERILESFQASR